MNEQAMGLSSAIACIKENTYKLTNARRVVLEVLFQEDRHLNSAEIIEQVKEKDPSIGRASIFRSLELFSDLGIIHPANYDPQMTRYVVMEGNGHHAHLVCTQCKQVIDLQDCQLEPVLKKYADENHFEIAGHLLELYGICQDCATNQVH